MRHEIQISLYWIFLSYQNYNAVSSGIYRGVAFRPDIWTLQSRPEGFFSKWQLNSQTWPSAMSGNVLFEIIVVNLCLNMCRFVLFIILCSYLVCLFLQRSEHKFWYEKWLLRLSDIAYSPVFPCHAHKKSHGRNYVYYFLIILIKLLIQNRWLILKYPSDVDGGGFCFSMESDSFLISSK